MDIEQAIPHPERVEQLGAGKVLVIAPRYGDEVIGCAGAIMAHLDRGDAVKVVLVREPEARAGQHQDGQGRSDLSSESADPEQKGHCPGETLAYGDALRWRLDERALRDTEAFIGRIGETIDQFEADLVYTASPSEPLPERRFVALATAEAARRSDRECRLVFFEIEGQLRPNRLLDISPYQDRKRAAMRCLASRGEPVHQLRALEARDTYRTLGLQTSATAAEAYLLFAAAELRSIQPGGPARRLWSETQGGEATRPVAAVPLISVIIRSIGRPEIADALISIAAQTYPSIEVLVVQACSGPPMVLPEAASRLPLRLVGEGHALGRSRAANLGLEHARGEYLTFLDDDDWWLPEHLAVLAERLHRATERAAYSGVSCVQKKAGEWQEVHVFNDPFDAARLLVDNFIPIHSVLFHRSLVEEGCRFDQDLDVYEDWDFWLQVARRTEMLHEGRVTAIYRLASGTGFGVTASPREVDQARARLFAKWRTHWTQPELTAILERARSAQGIEVMQRQVRHLEGQRNRLSESQQGLRAWITKLETRIGQLHAESQAERERLCADHESAIQRTRAELHARLEEQHAQFETRRLQYEAECTVTRAERDLARQTLEAVYGSTSWRLMAPLRGVRLAARSLARGGDALLQSTLPRLRATYRHWVPLGIRRRLSPAAVRVNTLLPSAELAQVGEPDARAWHPQPFELVRLRESQFAACAQGLDLPTSDSPQVSVIMPVYNNAGYTLECLTSIRMHPPRAAFELILIDDASQPSTRELLRRIGGICLIENEENLGFLRSCNRAAKAARGAYLLFLNNDTQVREGWLDRLIEPFADPEVGLTGSKLLYPSGHLQEAGVCMTVDGRARLVGLNGDPSAPEYNVLREVDYCSGASFMIERTLFERIGGFDERFAPAYYEDADLGFQVRELGRKVLYQPASEVIHHLSVTAGSAEEKLARIESSRARFVDKWCSRLADLDRVRLIAFYLPQYHPIPENDAWWGKGFTEWTNVTRARPNFRGHYQPQLPADLGYYDLRLPEVRRQQAELARQFGIQGFCYYYYWFNGHRLLHRPLGEVVASGEPDFPFCVCWANENWSRRWDGRESDILMAQHYTPEDDLAFIRALLPVLSDPRYIRIEGRALLLVYRATLLPDSQATTDRWREECHRAGLAEPYIAFVHSFHEGNQLSPGFDAAVEFPPHGHSVRAAPPGDMLNPDFQGHFFDYPATARAFAALRYPHRKVFRSVMPAWDNTARRQNDGHIFLDASPEVYEDWLRRMIAETREQGFGEERILFINAWNEWAEGNHLEPDTRFGLGYLEATRRALDAVITPREAA